MSNALSFVKDLKLPLKTLEELQEIEDCLLNVNNAAHMVRLYLLTCLVFLMTAFIFLIQITYFIL